MSTMIWKPVAVLVIALALVLVMGPNVYAETPTGEGPFDTMAPTGEWLKLESGDCSKTSRPERRSRLSDTGATRGFLPFAASAIARM